MSLLRLFCSYAVQSDLDCIVAHITLIKCLLILPGLVFLYHFYATNILVIFNMLPFIVVIIELVTLEQLYLAVTAILFVQQFLIFFCIIASAQNSVADRRLESELRLFCQISRLLAVFLHPKSSLKKFRFLHLYGTLKK